jgi:glycosyltransferase involved in cell wall biosynthesis
MLEQNNDSVLLLPVAEEEFTVDFAAAPDKVKERLFICFHQPPGAFRLNWKRFEDLDSLAGIFCLGEAQASYFRSVSRSPVHLIRHGVRHDFFRPSNDSSLRKGKRLLFVGQWLRDFATLADSMELIWSWRPDVHLDCVIPCHARNTEPLRRLGMDARVTWYAELTNEELRDLYQAADLLFLPLLDAVANNSVLEALASGLPVISTDIGGIAEYVPSGAGQLCQSRDARSHAAAVVSWLDNKARRAEAEGIARSCAVENFDWGKIGKQLVSYIVN